MVIYSLLIVTILIYLIAGFKITFRKDTPFYSKLENVPFSEMEQVELKANSTATSLGCFDNKTNVFIQALLIDNRIGYIYDKSFDAKKNIVPSFDQLVIFFRSPMASLQCMIIIPELSIVTNW